MEIVTCLLFAVVILKATSTLQAVRWMKNLTEEEIGVFRRGFANKAEYYAKLEACRGGLFPFGIKDFRLRRYVETRGEDSRLSVKLARSIVLVFQTTLYSYERLAGIVAIYSVVAASFIQEHNCDVFLSRETHLVLLYASTATVLGTNAVLSVEAIVSHTLLGGYAVQFHRILPQSAPLGRKLLMDLQVAMGRAAMTVFAGASAAYVARISFDAFKGDALRSALIHNAKDVLALFAQMIYWSTTLLSG